MNSIVIDDSRVSRAHANLTLHSDNITCIYNDLGSSSGSKVNGSGVSTTRIKHGDVIEIGLTTIHCSLLPRDMVEKLV